MSVSLDSSAFTPTALCPLRAAVQPSPEGGEKSEQEKKVLADPLGLSDAHVPLQIGFCLLITWSHASCLLPIPPGLPLQYDSGWDWPQTVLPTHSPSSTVDLTLPSLLGSASQLGLDLQSWKGLEASDSSSS